MIANVNRVFRNCCVLMCHISQSAQLDFHQQTRHFEPFPLVERQQQKPSEDFDHLYPNHISIARTEHASPQAKAHEQRPRNTHRTFTHSQTKIHATGPSFCHLLFKRFNLGHHRKAKTLNRSGYYRLATNMWLHKQLKFYTHRFCSDNVEEHEATQKQTTNRCIWLLS